VIECNSYMKLSTGSLQIGFFPEGTVTKLSTGSLQIGFFPKGTVTKQSPAHTVPSTFTDLMHLSVSVPTDRNLLEDKLF